MRLSALCAQRQLWRLVAWPVVVLLCAAFGGAAGEPQPGNSLCWNGGRNYELCCTDDRIRNTDICWVFLSVNQEFCCEELPPHYQQCFSRMQARVESKIAALAEEASSGGFANTPQEELDDISRITEAYDHLRAYPTELWGLACSAQGDHPVLWSDDCACCAPEEPKCESQDAAVGEKEYAACCNFIYDRRVVNGLNAPMLEAAISAQLPGAPFSRRYIREQAATFAPVDGHQRDSLLSTRCVFSIHNGEVHGCKESASWSLDAVAFGEALLQTVQVIHRMHPLPDLDLIVSGHDGVVDAWDPKAPVFARGAARWTSTLGLPGEWQMNLQQCRKHTRHAFDMKRDWHIREAKLVWRGGATGCTKNSCLIGSASRGGPYSEAMMECVEGGAQGGCHDSWQAHPRGRLVNLASMVDSIDAKFVGMSVDAIPGLRDHLEAEGLVGEPLTKRQQQAYKYTIAIDGVATADRIAWYMLSGTVVLIPETPWRQPAIMEMLEPFHHYVPVRYDLSDLLTWVSWLQANDEAAEAISVRARMFAADHFTCEGTLFFMDRLLRRYAEACVDD